MHPLLQSHHCGHYCLIGPARVPWNPLQGFPSGIPCRINTQSAESLYILKRPPPSIHGSHSVLGAKTAAQVLTAEVDPTTTSILTPADVVIH